MKIPDYLDKLDEEDRADDSRTYGTKECRRCGAFNLHWEEYDGKFVLCDKHNKVHKCKPVHYDLSKMYITK